jgi:hypothetical protein
MGKGSIPKKLKKGTPPPIDKLLKPAIGVALALIVYQFVRGLGAGVRCLAWSFIPLPAFCSALRIARRVRYCILLLLLLNRISYVSSLSSSLSRLLLISLLQRLCVTVNYAGSAACTLLR